MAAMLVLPVRLMRVTRVVAVVLAITCVLTIAVVLPFWVFLVAPRQLAARDQRLAALPLGLYTGVVRDDAGFDRAAVRRELDALVDLDRHDPSLLLLRAGCRFDAGDRAAAAADLQELAARDPTPYITAVAARYTAAVTSGQLVLSDLPEPLQQIDHLVAGFHALRRGDSEAAMRTLAPMIDYAPALQLQLVAAMTLQPPDPEALGDTAGALEKQRGHATSRTRQAMAHALLLRGRFEAARQRCEESLELRPAQPAVLHDLAAAEFGLGRLQPAKAHLQQALALQPGRADSEELLRKVLAAQERDG